MKFGPSIAFLAVLALALAGCADNSMNYGDESSLRGVPGGGLNPVLPDGDGCLGLPTAPDSLRVDLFAPTFTNPTAATNPLFPVGELERAVLLGRADGEPFRAETTRLPGTRTIILNGEPVATIVSQYVAWLDGRIEEVALDWYGQDEAGNVWYFGEDVFNYEDGVVVDTEGTWLAGEDGPVAMIMPADPQIGNVWRPENACPIVFEEVTALDTGVTVMGPSGPVPGALIVSELHMDGTYEDKTFAPGYGEFSTGSGPNLEALAVAVPTDFIGGSVPEDLDDLSDGAETMFHLARRGSWREIESLFEEMEEDWADYAATGVPPLLAAAMDDAIETLDEAVDARNRREVRQAAVDIAFAGIDFELRHEERTDIDLDLIEVFSLQLQIDRAAHDRGAIRSDLESIRVIRDRLAPPQAGRIDGALGALRTATEAGDEEALAVSAANLHETLAEMTGGAPR